MTLTKYIVYGTGRVGTVPTAYAVCTYLPLPVYRQLPSCKWVDAATSNHVSFHQPTVSDTCRQSKQEARRWL